MSIIKPHYAGFACAGAVFALLPGRLFVSGQKCQKKRRGINPLLIA
jgi:hypothetical protein